MYLSRPPSTVFQDMGPDGKPWEPVKGEIRLLLNEIIAGAEATVNPRPADLERNAVLSAGYYVVDAADFNKLHVARVAGDVTWNVAGIAYYKPYQFAADYNVGIVRLDAGPGYYWRNVVPRDGSVDNTIQTVRLRPGDSITIYRFTTNEFWVIGGYSRPAYVLLNSGADGYIERGPNGLYSGVWKRTLVAGANTLTFSGIYSGAPSFTGTAACFTGFAPVAATGVAAQIAQSGTGAGQLMLHNAGSSVTGYVSFSGLTE